MASRSLKLLFLLRGWQSDFGVSSGSPNLGQKVLVAKAVEHHLRLSVARIFRADLRDHGRAGLAVAQHDRTIGLHRDDLVAAGRQLRCSYRESERHFGAQAGLGVGNGGVEEHGQSHKRNDPDKVAIHNILLGAPFSGTQTEFVSQTFQRLRCKFARTH